MNRTLFLFILLLIGPLGPSHEAIYNAWTELVPREDLVRVFGIPHVPDEVPFFEGTPSAISSFPIPVMLLHDEEA